MQVQQREHLGDLRALAAPRRQDHRPEPDPRTARRVDPAVVHPRRRHRHRASTSRDRALAGVAVPPDQAMAALIYLACVRGDVGRNLFLERDGKHPPGTLTDQLVKVDDELGAALFPTTTLNTAASLPRRRWHADDLQLVGQSRRYAALSIGKPIHNFRSYLWLLSAGCRAFAACLPPADRVARGRPARNCCDRRQRPSTR